MVADVGARIRSLRTAKGLTQAQLADPLYTKAYISMLESGRTRASMKALEHIAGVLGVKPSDLLGGSSAPSTPQFQFIEARRLIEQQHAAEALPILESLEEGLTAADQLVRLRYLAISYNVTGKPKLAFPVIERAQRMADLLGNVEEQVRIKAVLAAAHQRTYAYDEAIRLLRECIIACENGVVKDSGFHFRRLVELALALTNSRDARQALATYERALALAEQFSDRPSIASLYAGLAKTYQNEGDLEAAINYNQKSLQVYEELGLLDQVACTLDNAALLFAEYGNSERANECLRRAASLAQETKRDGTLASIRTSEAEVLAKNDPQAAMAAAQEALKFARKVDQPDAQVRSLIIIGELRMASSPA
ncbi:MAG TPA: helix-turn-helix transcriptional regulator, partial [Candidatus Limnocylindria bacterium]|nr:helix-turn-helix transcriptional regulator [Candidatus Limnocylindria bacterium]